jgi:hypothetical protein
MPTIQGYSDGVFWERNALNEIKKNEKKKPDTENQVELSE